MRIARSLQTADGGLPSITLCFRDNVGVFSPLIARWRRVYRSQTFAVHTQIYVSRASQVNRPRSDVYSTLATYTQKAFINGPAAGVCRSACLSVCYAWTSVVCLSASSTVSADLGRDRSRPKCLWRGPGPSLSFPPPSP